MTRDSRARGVWIFAISLLVARVAMPATTYTDRTTFENAVAAALGLESFDAEVADGSSIVFASGIQSDGSNGLGDAINRVTGGLWGTRIRTPAGISGYLTVTWTLPNPTMAVGIDFSSISSSRGVEISADWDGSGPQSFVLWDQLATSNGFFGVIGTSSFTEITLVANGTGDNDFFGADNIAFALPEGVFADGFESGNLSSWSGTAP